MAFIHEEEHLEEQTRPGSDRIWAHGRFRVSRGGSVDAEYREQHQHGLLENQLGHGLSGSQLTPMVLRWDARVRATHLVAAERRRRMQQNARIPVAGLWCVLWMRLRRDVRAQDLIEYALMAGFIAVASAA